MAHAYSVTDSIALYLYAPLTRRDRRRAARAGIRGRRGAARVIRAVRPYSAETSWRSSGLTIARYMQRHPEDPGHADGVRVLGEMAAAGHHLAAKWLASIYEVVS